jgi:hypothetical protein
VRDITLTAFGICESGLAARHFLCNETRPNEALKLNVAEGGYTMRFGKKTQVAAGIFSLALLVGVTSGCAGKSGAEDGMAARVEAAASKAEAAANKAEAAARSASEAAQRAEAAAQKAEAIFQKHMKK